MAEMPAYVNGHVECLRKFCHGLLFGMWLGLSVGTLDMEHRGSGSLKVDLFLPPQMLLS